MSAPLSGWQPTSDFAGSGAIGLAQDNPAPLDVYTAVPIGAGAGINAAAAPYDMQNYQSWRLAVSSWTPAVDNNLEVTLLWSDVSLVPGAKFATIDADAMTFNSDGAGSPLIAGFDGRYAKGPVKGRYLAVQFANIGSVPGTMTGQLDGSLLATDRIRAREGSPAFSNPVDNVIGSEFDITHNGLAADRSHLLLAAGTSQFSLSISGSSGAPTSVNANFRFLTDSGTIGQLPSLTLTLATGVLTPTMIILPRRPVYIQWGIQGGTNPTVTLRWSVITLGDG